MSGGKFVFGWNKCEKKRGAAVCFFFHCGMWFDGLLLLQCVARPPALSLIEENQGVTISL